MQTCISRPSPRTNRRAPPSSYDRTEDNTNLDEIERIRI
jgi:hypothetical protein